MSTEFRSVRQEFLVPGKIESLLQHQCFSIISPEVNFKCDAKRHFFDLWRSKTISPTQTFEVTMLDTAPAKTVPNSKFSYATRSRNNLLNRCISSNITVIHSEDGKPPVITKQSTFSIPSRSGQSGIFHVTRIEEDCTESQDEESSSTTSSTSLASLSECSSPVPELPILRVKPSHDKNSYEAVKLAMRSLNWKEQAKKDGTYDVYWHYSSYEDMAHENVAGVYAVNKLPGMLELSYKVQLSRILKRMQTLYPGEFNFYPMTWVIPEQYHEFIGEVAVAKSKTSRYTPDNKSRKLPQYTQAFIVKPDQGKQGDGIYLVSDPRDVQAAIGSRSAIVQEYIDSPLLLDGYKFDIRIYVVVARLNPVEIYLCKEGLVRLCTVLYHLPSKQNLKNAYMHLTNYSLNKNSEDFVQTDAAGTGSKRTLTCVEKELAKKGYDVKRMRREIRQLVVKTILALLPDLTVWNHASNTSKLTRCFQILGFDVMLSSDMKVHLLEVNGVPSLNIHAEQEVESESGVYESVISAIDQQVKVALIKDTLKLIAIGEENMNMKDSCLQRIFPVRILTRFSRYEGGSMQQCSKYCEKRCEDHNTPVDRSNHRSSQELHDMKEHAGNYRHSKDGWANGRLCPQCNSPVMTKKQPRTVIQYTQPEIYPLSSEWRFFDHRVSGSQLLANDRQPFINPPKIKSESIFLNQDEEHRSSDDDELYKQCVQCGAYLNQLFGPGILQERELNQYNPSASGRLGVSKAELSNQFSELLMNRSKKIQDEKFAGPRNTFSFSDFRSIPQATILSPPHFKVNGRLPFEIDPCSWGFSDVISSTSSSLSDGDSSDIRYDRDLVGESKLRKAAQRKSEPVNSFSGYYVMLLRRAAKVFIYFNGIKSSLTIGATAFRNMARKCNLCEQGALPSIDILYIDTLRQWQSQKVTHGTPFYIRAGEKKDLKSQKAYLCQTFGLPFQGFLEALFRIASNRFRGDNLRDKLYSLLRSCEQYINSAKKIEKAEKLRLHARGNTLLSPWKRPTSANRSQGRYRPSKAGHSSSMRRFQYTSQ